MTATRDRRSDPGEDAEPAWDERSILGKSRGLPWWGAVLLAFGLAAIAAAFDMQRQDTLGFIYQGAYFLGCVAAVGLVRRRSLFGPMVQPPLVFAVTAVAAVVLLAPDTGGAGGLKSLIFTVALPLTSNFPTMALTTGVTVGLGAFRLWRERDPEAEPRPAREPREPREPRERPSRDRAPPARGRRGEPDAVDFDGADAPEAPMRRGSDRGRRGETGRRDPAGRRGSRRDDPDLGGRGTPDRPTRGRPDPDADEPEPGRFRRRPGRDARPDQSTRDSGERGGRSSRGRTRDADPPPRRRDPAADPRPRREDRARRDSGDRSAPVRQPRRRPQDPYR